MSFCSGVYVLPHICYLFTQIEQLLKRFLRLLSYWTKLFRSWEYSDGKSFGPTYQKLARFDMVQKRNSARNVHVGSSIFCLLCFTLHFLSVSRCRVLTFLLQSMSQVSLLVQFGLGRCQCNPLLLLIVSWISLCFTDQYRFAVSTPSYPRTLLLSLE